MSEAESSPPETEYTRVCILEPDSKEYNVM